VVTHTLIILVILSLLELSLWIPPLWRYARQPIAGVVIVALAVASGWLLGFYGSAATALVVIGSAYRIVNLLRVVEGRAPVKYMAAAILRTSLLLICFQVVVMALVLAGRELHIAAASWLDVIRIVDFVVALLLLIETVRHIRKTEPLSIDESTTRDLPTLSVAIPARNETDDLEECLQSLVSSSYPKLEILVLDDCSQNKHTPEIIKDFAHAGVRFIAGKVPPEHWLAKNYAYQQLAAEANGEILLFCGVDTRFRPGSLTAMVQTMKSRKKSMLSVLPQNVLPGGRNPESVIVQPLRYAWELALPRRWLQRPPVLSTCWLIQAKLLKASGGFKAITNSTSVESYFARAAIQKKQGYSFLQSLSILGLSSHKLVPEQRDTAIRTRYPQTHRRPEIVAVLSLLEVLVFVLPFVLLIDAVIDRSWINAVFGVINVGLLTYFYVTIVRVTYGSFLGRSLWVPVFAAVYDVGLLNYSMWRYEFREVLWKGRNICLPLMHAGFETAASSVSLDQGLAQKQ
jgi:glycosyltransferase involved in cell wall biosynthesis